MTAGITGHIQAPRGNAAAAVRWQDHKACSVANAELFFPERGGSSSAARAICAKCPVRTACLRYALEHHEKFGIWGGTSERERRRLMKLSDTEVAKHDVKLRGVTRSLRSPGTAA